jgi:hypothetical protein
VARGARVVMKLLAPLLAAKIRDFMVIKAHAAGPRRLFVALEAFVHETKDAATCVVSVDLDTLAVELVHEVAGSSIDYLHVDGWHGLVQLDAVIEVGGKQPIVTQAKLGTPTLYGNQLAAIARVGDTTLVCGTKSLEGHVLDGFVARVAGGKLAMIMETSKLGQAGPLTALCAGTKHVYTAGGVQDSNGKYMLFRGDNRAFTEGVPIGDRPIQSLYAKTDGSVMVGCDLAEAWSYEHGKPPRALPGITMKVDGAVELRGAEYWMSHDSHEQLVLWQRSGVKLAKKYKTKQHYIGYRSAPEARMTATDDLLVVTNKDRIHIFDGKTWSQLAIQPNVKKLFKRLPAAMKR